MLVLGQASGIGNLAVLLGSTTGRDGIGGVSVLASAGFGDEEEDAEKRPSVQVGDPFEEKRLIEGCLELLDEGLGQANPEKIEELIPVIVKLWIIQGFVTYFAKYMAAWFGGSISKKLRIVIFSKLLKIPDYWFQQKGRHGDMLTRMSADINKISDFFTQTVSEILIVPTKIILSSIVLFIVAPRLTITLLVTVPILAKIFKIGISKIQHYTHHHW